MSRTPKMVMTELLAITPLGAALPADPNSSWADWLAPLANEISLCEVQGEQLLVEVDPGEATYLLPDYERVLGPDPFGRDVGPLTIAQQRTLALSRWTAKYGVRPADFIALAASFGVTITIREYVLTKASEMQAGDLLVGNPVQYVWLVNLPAAVLEIAEASGMSAGDLISSFEASNVQNVLASRSPAQLTPVFNYA